MGDRKRNRRGQYVETVSEDRVLAALEAADDPFMATGDVAERIGCSDESARKKLMTLHDRGAVERRNVRGAVVVWWLAGGTSGERAADIESAADRVGGRGLFAGNDGEAFADAVEASREEFDRDSEDRYDDLFGQ